MNEKSKFGIADIYVNGEKFFDEKQTPTITPNKLDSEFLEDMENGFTVEGNFGTYEDFLDPPIKGTYQLKTGETISGIVKRSEVEKFERGEIGELRHELDDESREIIKKLHGVNAAYIIIRNEKEQTK